MTATPFMPMYWGDYFRDTRLLSTVEHGAYLLLIGEYWVHGGLPTDDASLAKLTGMPLADWLLIKPTIVGFFQKGWRHKRIDAELARVNRLKEAQSVAGRLAGKASAAKRLATTRQRAVNETSTIPEPEPRQKERAVANATATHASDADFDRFWSVYPHKVGKLDARKAFNRAVRKTPLSLILEGLRRYIEGKPVDRQWLNPSTFLNQERFNDAPATNVINHPAMRGPASEREQRVQRTAEYRERRLAELLGRQGDDTIDGEFTESAV